MFGFACPLCWDKNCNCTQEALDKYYADINGDQPQEPFIYNIPEIKGNIPVTKGDLITTKIVDGEPINELLVKHITKDNKLVVVNIKTGEDFVHTGEYIKICSTTEK